MTSTFNITFFYRISCKHLHISRSLAAIVIKYEISTVSHFPIEKPKLPKVTLS